ncbi:MAG: bifunctional folylpolyglutamate synthase/dihydrofolate synthase [Oscillospiraceae bacterium]|nr:bifunctional folylpolyglutamate synthase/dihydrofolate synthase [Oscillospiraceae bacterium]
MTVERAIEYIHSNYWNGGTFGLDRTVELLDLLGHPEKGLKFIHIGGTNGKGSTASMSANILRKAGYTVGLYTSPYIFRFHERMQVNGECISDEELVDIVEKIQPLARSMKSEPSEFELVTCIAFEYFKRHKCDIIALEVGLGGEFDATNTIEPPEVAVMTNIGLDHVELLGDTLEKIAETKSKIIKKGSDAVIYREPASVEAVFEARCKEVGAELTRADFDSIELVSASLEGQIFNWGAYRGIEMPLLGDHQLKNAAVVLTVVEVLRKRGWKISEEAVREGIATVSWPGRFELIGKKPTFIIDGGHNPQCIEALVKNVRDYLDGRKLTILTGVLGDKDYNEMYRDMASFASEFVTVTPDNPRAMSSENLKAYLEQFGKPVTACETVAQGVELAKSLAGEDGVVLCYGSLYMLGDVVNAAKEK